MGEPTRFRAGDKAPNDGEYIEVGEYNPIMGVQDPKRVKLKKGQRFPDTTNDRRHWMKM